MISAHLTMLAAAIIAVEGANDGHPNGPMQITPIMLSDYNAHVGRRQRLTALECKRIGPSMIVFRWYVRHACADAKPWQIACRWNAGRDGDTQLENRAVIDDYANRVENIYLAKVKQDLKYGQQLLAQQETR